MLIIREDETLEDNNAMDKTVREYFLDGEEKEKNEENEKRKEKKKIKVSTRNGVTPTI